MSTEGKIVFVPTPIGNLGDISERAKDALLSCEVVYCEDTRVTGKLLSLLNIKSQLVRMDENTIDSRVAELIDRVGSGETVCYCSDAGMPGISDPGSRIVAAAREANLTVEVLPGANACLTALVASGFDTTEFYFAGFLPKKKSQKKEKLENHLSINCPTVIYESPNRIIDTLECLPKTRRVCVARELTKIHEEVLVASVQELLDELKSRGCIKGEIVLVVDVASTDEVCAENDKRINRAKAYVALSRARNMSATDIKKDLINFFDVPKNLAFELANYRS